MTKVFRGRFDCKVDAKGRLIVPAAFREGRSPKNINDWVVTNSLVRQRRCLDLYLLPEWEKLEKKLSTMPQLNKDVQTYQRFYMSGGQMVQLDNQHRLSLPQNLREFIGVEQDLVIVGMSHKIELWAARTWAELEARMIESFDETLERVALLEAGEK